MVKTKFKKAVSLMLAAVMSLTAFTGIGATTAFAAVGEKADVYLVDYPRSGDTNNNGEWGHGNLNYMNGWKGLSTKYTGLRAMGSYSGNIAYCIEPGTGQRTGDTLTEKDENFFNNISPNGTISGDDIRLLIGRILQYGYRGGISTSWKSQNESDANCIAHAYATQILIWETIVGERDAGFNHVSTSGYNAVLECVSTAHPLRSKILSYYNSMVTSVQNHTKVPSFCTRSSGSAKVNELEWNGSKYVATLTDTNGVLGNYNFSANIDGVSFSVSGNKLTVSMEKAPSKEFTITAAKKNGVRRGVVVWSDGIHQNGNGIQDVVTYAQEVSDPVSGFVKMKVSYGSCQIVKTSEDGKVDGIQFTISGNGVNQTVTTANGGKFQLDNLMPGVYTVTEQSIDKYVPQEVHRVTVVAGQVSKVNFNNVLKRGNLQVIKSSEDNLVEGVTFHLYGTSLSGIAVDEYAVTDKNGVASFDDVLISGTTPFKVLDDDKMDDLVESIKQNGVLTPVLVRPDKNNSYEMISGHRRMHAAIKAGLETIPAIVRDMEDDEAIVIMVDANIQREELLPSEKAFAYKMKMDAMKRQGARNDIASSTSTQIGWKSETAEAIGKQVGESKNQVRRYIRLTELIPDLLDYVDKKRLQFTVAVDISYIDKEIQTWLFEYIKENGTVKAVQVAALRTALEVGPMTQAKMISILVNSQPGRKQEQKITLSEKKLRNFFSDKYTAEDMESVILELLDQWKRGEITV